jgi:hypothetical protein
MMHSLRLPGADGSWFEYCPGEPAAFPTSAGPFRSRVVYAAAHVVCDRLADNSPNAPACLDWEATLAYRHHLWSLGFAVAEAMDTAQRGMGLDWSAAQELIRRSLLEARSIGAPIACGAGTDQLAPSDHLTLQSVQAAYEEQCSFIEGLGGRVILMASRALATCARTPEDYLRVYDRILAQLAHPAIIHWLGEMFDPGLAGYWGSPDLDAAMEICLSLIERHANKIEGIKMSLLDAEREIAMRRRLPPGVRMYTGDDFHYPDLLLGDEQGYSHALLGIFDAIAPAAAAALQALDTADREGCSRLLGSTVPLAHALFEQPTMYYKAGLVFLAYLNGYQTHFRLLAALEKSRSLVHLAKLFVLVDRAGLLRDPEQATARMRQVLAGKGGE